MKNPLKLNTQVRVRKNHSLLLNFRTARRLSYRRLILENLEPRYALTSPASFAAPIHFSSDGSLYGMTSGDFNSDGIVDLVSGNYQKGSLDVHIGRGDGTFLRPVSYEVGGQPNSVTTADIDQDGYLDIATGTYGGRQVVVLYGNGNGTFGNRASWSNANRLPVEVKLADMNGDGRLDIVAANYVHTAGSVVVILANGPRQFGTPLEFVSGNGTTGVAVADFNGDLALDVVTSDHQSGTISIMLNDGAGNLGNRSVYAAGSLPAWLISDRFDGDETMDVAVGHSGSAEIIVYYGNGDGSVRLGERLAASGGISFVRHGDFNGDNVIDFVATIPTNNSVVYFGGRGDGSFASPVYFPTGSGPIGLVAVDLDGNGTSDLATANYEGRNVSVLKNLSPAADPHLLVTAPAVVAQSVATTFTVSVVDATGIVRTDFEGLVEFLGDAAAIGLPTTYQFTASNNGTASFPVTYQSLRDHIVSVRLVSDPNIVSGRLTRVVTAFSAQIGGPYRVPEESASILQGSVNGRDVSTVTFSWDLDGDGVFGETGAAATRGTELSATPMYVAPQVDVDTTSQVRFRVTDADGLVAESSASIVIRNISSLDTPIPASDELRVSQAVWPNGRISWENTKIAANQSGRKVVTWSYDANVGAPFPGIQARVFDDNNTPLTGDIRVPGAPGVDHSFVQGVALLDDGSFAIAWQRWGGDANGWGIRARVFNPDGSPRTGEFLVNTSIQVNHQSGVTITALSNGRFAVTWQDPNTWVDGSGNSIIGKVFGLNGETYVPDQVMNDRTIGDQWGRRLVGTSDGGFLMYYTSFNALSGLTDVFVRRFNANGTPAGLSTRVSPISDRGQTAGGLAIAPDGTYLVSWQVESQQTQQDVYVRRFDASGVPLSQAIRVNSYLTGHQANSDVAVDATGEYVVSWESDGQDGSLHGVYARRIDPDGIPIGSEFRVNSHTNDAQWGSSVDFGAPGELLFSWKSEGQFAGNSGAIMRQFEMTARNLPPEANAGGPYSVTEGQSLSLSAALSVDPNGDALSYSWDVNGDGTYGDIFGVTPTLSWGQLRALGIDGPSHFDVRVRVNDGVNTTTSASTNLAVANLAPTVGLSGPSSILEGLTYKLTLGPVTDPGLDIVSKADIRWGDGSATTINEIGEVSHVYEDGLFGMGSNSSIRFTEIVDADTMVNDAAGFGGPHAVHGNRTTLWATNWFNPGAGGSLASYPLFRFNLEQIRLTEVRGDATLRVYVMGPTSSAHHFGNPRRVDLYEITSPWTEATTNYASRPSASYLNSRDVVYHGNDRWIEWTVPQSVVQKWLDQPESNHGLMLVNELPDSFFYDLVFAAREFGNGLGAQLVFDAAGPFRINVDLTDEDGFYRSTATHEVTVLNVPPVGLTDGPQQVVPYQPFSLVLNAIDPSRIDQAAGFRFDIDWNGDGIFEQSLTDAQSGTAVTHVYDTLGTRIVRMRVTDKDGGSSEFEHTLNVRAFYFDGGLVIGGTGANDLINIRQGTQAGTITAIRNGSNLGTFSAQNVRIYSGPGEDSIIADGNSSANNVDIELNRITMDGLSIDGFDNEYWTANAQGGNDTIRLIGGTVDISGGSGSDNLISQRSGSAEWIISEFNAGELRIGTDRFTFRAIESLAGSQGDDTFRFLNGGRITGQILGNDGANAIDFESLSIAISVNLQSKSATGIGSFDQIQFFTGSQGSDTLIGANVQNTWELRRNNGTILNQSIFLDGFEHLVGGAQEDLFLVDSTVSLGPTLTGGSGVDTLSYRYRSDDIVVNRQLRSATAISAFDQIEIFEGGTGDDTWIGPDAATEWSIAATGMASIRGSSILSFERLVGGRESDRFQLANNEIVVQIVGGDGEDWVEGPDLDNIWWIDGIGRGNIANKVHFIEIERNRGGTMSDRWLIGPNGNLRSIDGNTGRDTLDYGARTTGVSIDMGTRSADGVSLFVNIEALHGSVASDQVLGPSIATSYTITGTNEVSALGIAFSSIENWFAGQANDTFRIAVEDARITGTLNAGNGIDTLIGSDGPNDWVLTSLQSGQINSSVSFSQFENLRGGVNNDRFMLYQNGGGFSAINGGLGFDELNYSMYQQEITVDLSANTAPGVASFSSLESLVGSAFHDELYGPNAATTWTVFGLDKGTVGSLLFESFEDLRGNASNDTFRLSSDSGALSGMARGGAGTDQIFAFSSNNTWSLSGIGTGDLNGRFPFSGIENLQGGSLADDFRMIGETGGFGTIHGGNGLDTIDYGMFDSAISVTVTTTTSTGVNRFISIENWKGSSFADTFTGPNNNSTWNVVGDRAGRIGSMHFESFETWNGGNANDTFSFSTDVARVPQINGGAGTDTLLGFLRENLWNIQGSGTGTLNGDTAFSQIENFTGGSLEDRFEMAPSGVILGTLSGGGGTNTLSYASWTTNVQVNQSLGRATAINSLIGNIQIIIGGSGDDQLTAFPSLASVLVGNGGNDRLVGSSNRDILIGGSGLDILMGIGGEDILIAGWTSFDNQSEALQSLHAEWRSTRTNFERINNLRGSSITGIPLNKSFFLRTQPNNRTVFDDDVVDILYGGSHTDWFLATFEDQLEDRLQTEIWDEL